MDSRVIYDAAATWNVHHTTVAGPIGGFTNLDLRAHMVPNDWEAVDTAKLIKTAVYQSHFNISAPNVAWAAVANAITVRRQHYANGKYAITLQKPRQNVLGIAKDTLADVLLQHGTTAFYVAKSVTIVVTCTKGLTTVVLTAKATLDAKGTFKITQQFQLPNDAPLTNRFFPMSRKERAVHRRQITAERDRYAQMYFDLQIAFQHGEYQGGAAEAGPHVLAIDGPTLLAALRHAQTQRQARDQDLLAFGVDDTAGTAVAERANSIALLTWLNPQLRAVSNALASHQTGFAKLDDLAKLSDSPKAKKPDSLYTELTRSHFHEEQIRHLIGEQRSLQGLKTNSVDLVSQDARQRGYITRPNPEDDVVPFTGNREEDERLVKAYHKACSEIDDIARTMNMTSLYSPNRMRTVLRSILILQQEPDSPNYEARTVVKDFCQFCTLVHQKCQGESDHKDKVKNACATFADARLRSGNSEMDKIKAAQTIQEGLEEAFPDFDILIAPYNAAPFTGLHGLLNVRWTDDRQINDTQRLGIERIVRAYKNEKQWNSMAFEDGVKLMRMSQRHDVILSVRDSGEHSLAQLRLGAQPKPHQMNSLTGINQQAFEAQFAKTELVDGEAVSRYQITVPPGPGTEMIDADAQCLMLEKSIKEKTLKDCDFDSVPTPNTARDRQQWCSGGGGGPCNIMGLIGHWYKGGGDTRILKGVRVLVPKVMMDDHTNGNNLMQHVVGCKDQGTGSATHCLEAYVPLANLAAFDAAAQGGIAAACLTGDYDMGNIMDTSSPSETYDGKRASYERSEELVPKHGGGGRGLINTELGNDPDRVMHGSQDAFGTYSMKHRSEVSERKPNAGVLNPAVEHTWCTKDGPYHCQNMLDNLFFELSQGCKPVPPLDESAMAHYGATRDKVKSKMEKLDKQSWVAKWISVDRWEYRRDMARAIASMSTGNRDQVDFTFSIPVVVTDHHGRHAVVKTFQNQGVLTDSNLARSGPVNEIPKFDKKNIEIL